jgi:drug/metabolite transporter (DMT)-like permease
MTRRGLILFAALSLVWGIPYLLIRVAVRELAPETLVFVRTGIGALVLLPVAALRDALRPLASRWFPVLVYTAIEAAIPWLLLAHAETRLSSSLTGLLIAALPLVTALVVKIAGVHDQQGGRRLWIGLTVGFAGATALVGLNIGQVNAVAIAEVAGVVICYAVGPIVLVRYLQDAPSVGVIAISLLLTSVACAPLGFARRPGPMPSTQVIEAVLGLALVCTALAFLLFFALIAEIGPVRASLIAYVNPAVAAIAGVAFLQESFTIGMGVGFALVLVGSGLATYHVPVSRRERVPLPAEGPLEVSCSVVMHFPIEEQPRW